VASLIGAILLMAAPIPAAASEEAEALIQHSADDVAAIIANPSATVREKRSDIWQIIDRNTNSEQLARSTLGNYAGALPQKEIDRYVGAFRRYMRLQYAGQLAEATSLETTVTGSSEMRRSHATRVMSKVSLSGDVAHEVDWRVVGDEFVSDIQIDGIWLISDLKNRLDPVLAKSGGSIDAAIAYLNRDLPSDE